MSRSPPVITALHDPAQIVDVDVESCLRHPLMSKYCKRVFVTTDDKSTKLDIPIYYLNPKNGHSRRKHMEDQFERSGVGEHSTRIEAITFPKGSSKAQRAYLLSAGHARGWAKALQDRNEWKQANGAIFMEDDVCLLAGWRHILKQMIDDQNESSILHKCEVVRFDVMPHYESSRPGPKNGSVFAFSCISPCCAGAYYMSWTAIQRAIYFFKKYEEKWKSFMDGRVCANEHIIHSVGRSFGPHKYAQCIPPLAVQTWFAEKHGIANANHEMLSSSSIQHFRHILWLRTTLCASFLKEHGQRYHISSQARETLGEVLRELYDPPCATLHPVKYLAVTPEWMWVRAVGDKSKIDMNKSILSAVSEISRKRRKSIIPQPQIQRDATDITIGKIF